MCVADLAPNRFTIHSATQLPSWTERQAYTARLKSNHQTKVSKTMLYHICLVMQFGGQDFRGTRSEGSTPLNHAKQGSSRCQSPFKGDADSKEYPHASVHLLILQLHAEILSGTTESPCACSNMLPHMHVRRLGTAALPNPPMCFRGGVLKVTHWPYSFACEAGMQSSAHTAYLCSMPNCFDMM